MLPQRRFRVSELGGAPSTVAGTIGCPRAIE
jgi:hypothetical protein